MSCAYLCSYTNKIDFYHLCQFEVFEIMLSHQLLVSSFSLLLRCLFYFSFISVFSLPPVFHLYVYKGKGFCLLLFFQYLNYQSACPNSYIFSVFLEFMLLHIFFIKKCIKYMHCKNSHQCLKLFFIYIFVIIMSSYQILSFLHIIQCVHKEHNA